MFKKYKKGVDKHYWHKWFAWFPVVIEKYAMDLNPNKIIKTYAWLTFVERKIENHYYHSGDYWSFWREVEYKRE